LLTKEFCIPKDRLLVTIYHTDEEAKNIWKKVEGNIQIIPIANSDNFWSMGDLGPCGPCTEIFFDHGENVFGGVPGSKDQDGDRYMEIWNIVFMQYEQLSGGKRVSLKKQSIDTGMGLERIASVLQGVQDNYETDLFKDIICTIREISKTNYENVYPSYKVIADHIRSISFLLSDGVLPSNDGRGYVLRRILRRAMRHGNMIGIREP
jgi:alanyl-tRNA synthetase